MIWTIEIRAVHESDGRVIERAAGGCPILLGRDAALSAVVLDDVRVSKVHASVDVQHDRLLVCDVHSTNGTHTVAGRLDPDRWIDLGPADQEAELLLGGWRVRVKGSRVEDTATAHSAPPSSAFTTVDPRPFGASQGATTAGDQNVSAFVRAFPKIVDRLSESALAARTAVAGLEAALDREVGAVDAAERGGLARALCDHYPEARSSAALAPYLGTKTDAGAPPQSVTIVRDPADEAALAAVQALARCYVDPNRAPTTPAEIMTFAGRLKTGIDALLLGLVQATAGQDAHVSQMRLEGVAPSTVNASVLARQTFDWSGVPDGGAAVRRVFVALSIHQMAFFNGVCSGIRDLLDQLSPDAIAAAQDEPAAPFWHRLLGWFTAPMRLLAAYRQRHRELATRESERFSLIFGSRFAQEYRAFVRESEVAPLAPDPYSPQRGETAPLAPPMGAPLPRQNHTVPLAPPIRREQTTRGQAR